MNTYKLFCRLRGNEKWACISPATLKFDNAVDAETVVERYRNHDRSRGNGKTEYQVFKVDANGYIVN